jgi:hypothetical protein
MESRITKQNSRRAGRPFFIYALICPITLEVKYVGQTCDLRQRTSARAHVGASEGVAKEWLDSMGYLRPYRAILESGVNRIVRLRYECARKPGAGRTPHGYKDVWLSSICEAKWLKRFRKTVLNANRKEIERVWGVLVNPPLPWEE